MLIVVALTLAAAGAAFFISRRHQPTVEKTDAPDPAKWRTAVHESGHALVAWHMSTVLDVGPATIEPATDRPELKGVTHIVYHSRARETREGMRQMIVILLAGGAAETIVLGDNMLALTLDFYQAIEIATAHHLGIDPRAVAGLPPEALNAVLGSSDGIGGAIRDQVDMTLLGCYAEAALFLFERRDLLRRLAERLHRRGTLTAKELRKILGKRPA